MIKNVIHVNNELYTVFKVKLIDTKMHVYCVALSAVEYDLPCFYFRLSSIQLNPGIVLKRRALG